MEYRKQEKYPHRYFESCPLNIGQHNITVKPFQPVEMVTKEELRIYNDLRKDEIKFYIQGVVIIPDGTFIIYTYRDLYGKYKVTSQLLEWW